MKTFICFLVLIVVFVGNVSSAKTEEVFLYQTLFFSDIPDYAPENIDLSKYPDSIKSRLLIYQQRAKTFKTKFIVPSFPPEAAMGYSQTIRIEKAIYSLIQSDGIETLAAHYAESAKIYLEWEGESDGPLDEARYAENYLATNPESPLKPYLVLFLLNRYRIAFECLGFEKKTDAQADAASKYRYFLALAGQSADPLVQEIAKDIDRQKYLYIRTANHPQFY